jgi:hypothetical protein
MSGYSFLIDENLPPFPLYIGSLIEELILLWGASLPSEFQDQIVYLPLGH